MQLSDHQKAVWQALFVTFLWSTSWVLIKLGLQNIPALTFAGLRYTLAFLVLLPFVLRPAVLRPAVLRPVSPGQKQFALTRWQWLQLSLLGLLFYALTQGAQFLGLAYLPAVTVSLMLNLTSLLVAVLGIFLLGEIPTRLQWVGAGLLLAGVLAYFYPIVIQGSQGVGLLIMAGGVAANALSSILGRSINRRAELLPLVVTTVSMGVGAFLLLLAGILLQGLPRLNLVGWGIVVWLALVNTAFAFTLWNHTLRHLSALESTVINNTMLVQIAILAWIFLGEQLTTLKLLGVGLVGAGALLVQLRRSASGVPANPVQEALPGRPAAKGARPEQVDRDIQGDDTGQEQQAGG